MVEANDPKGSAAASLQRIVLYAICLQPQLQSFKSRLALHVFFASSIHAIPAALTAPFV